MAASRREFFRRAAVVAASVPTGFVFDWHTAAFVAMQRAMGLAS
jgi:hypothetical protein